MSEMVDQALISPRYLAGPGDAAWVTVALHGAAGWSHGHEPLLPRVVLSSPDQKSLLRLEPDPGDQWWRITHNGGSASNSWYASFGARTPVELIAAVTDALTDPAYNERAAADPTRPLRRAGWQTSPSGEFRSPDGIVKGERITFSGMATWFITAALGPDDAVWRARFDGRAPASVVAAFTEALAATEPLSRTHEQTLGLSRQRITLHWQQVTATSVASALPDRVERLATRRTSTASPASEPPRSAPGRTR
ncbi:DUF317 domain-containing protein [Streptomyces sp. NPDC054835]|uniref:DUF317 domain-containing protein n=1 Tax=Streptomyces exfoliatus TaxID=1905 RepID=UPI0004659E5A|nr:DUF317 domain-containing protein [Streptomyces exfoliatus]